MIESGLNERSGSSKTSKSSKLEMTAEQIQQQNILRLNGLASTGPRNTENTRESTPNLSNNVTNSNILSEDISNNSEESLNDMDKFGLKGLIPLLKPLDNTVNTNGSSSSSINNNNETTINDSNTIESNNEDITNNLNNIGNDKKLLNQESNDYNLISKGMDLNMLGLDLSINSKSKKLSKFLASPWLETTRSEVETIFCKPDSFNIGTDELPPIEFRINSLNDQTLFYIFYTKPRDILQEIAARELIRRNWRYHKELQVWLTKDSSCEPIATGLGSEEGTYIFFDPVSWEMVTKSFLLYYNSLI